MSTRRAGSNHGPLLCWMSGRRNLVILGATVAMLVVCDASARAGVYTVSGCRTGWVPDVRNTSGDPYPGAYDECDQATSKSLYASVPAPVAGGRANSGDYGGWRFVAPPDTVIVGLVLTWSGRGDYAAGDWGPTTVNVATSADVEVISRIDPIQKHR